MRERLFAEGAANDAGTKVYRRLRKVLLPELRRSVRAGHDLHDFELMVLRAIQLDIALERAKRQIKSAPPRRLRDTPAKRPSSERGGV